MATHLIIKLGALGDFVQATTAFRAVRLAHADDQLILLTTKTYVDFAKRLALFDDIWIDSRPLFFEFKKLINFRSQVEKACINRIYDFQGVDRTQIYQWILKGTYQTWIGFTNNMAHIHPQKRFEILLNKYGVKDFSNALDLSSMSDNRLIEQPQKPYILIVPGASMAHKGAKKWPEENFAELAKRIMHKGYAVVIIGGAGESFPIITQQCSKAINLVGKTSFYEVIGLGSKALLTIGNDTGPTLLAASGGSPTMTFFSKFNPPNKGGPVGDQHHQIYQENLKTLSVDDVWQKFTAFKHT